MPPAELNFLLRLLNDPLNSSPVDFLSDYSWGTVIVISRRIINCYVWMELYCSIIWCYIGRHWQSQKISKILTRDIEGSAKRSNATRRNENSRHKNEGQVSSPTHDDYTSMMISDSSPRPYRMIYAVKYVFNPNHHS